MRFPTETGNILDAVQRVYMHGYKNRGHTECLDANLIFGKHLGVEVWRI
jgi:hypothetical protein